MLQKQDFAEAETALRAFIDTHPKDRLAGNAHYWLGEYNSLALDSTGSPHVSYVDVSHV